MNNSQSYMQEQYLFAINENKIEIFIQLFTPLVIYGLRGTIYSVIAHEFLHYLDILNKIINLEITSDTINNTLFENILQR